MSETSPPGAPVTVQSSTGPTEASPTPAIPETQAAGAEAATAVGVPSPPSSAAAPPPVAPPPAWQPAHPGLGAAVHFGPMGKRRSPVAVVVLSILTLGLYALFWHRRVNREVADFDPRISVHLGRTTWAVAIPTLVGWLVAAAAGARIVAAHLAGRHLDAGVAEGVTQYGVLALVAVPYLVLLLPFSVVAVAMTAERIRILEDRLDILGEAQLRPAAAVAWLLLPVVGGLVLLAQLQRRLNAVWERAAT